MTESRAAILITGASAGLGVEYARQLAACDSRELLLVARRTDRLEALKQELGDKAHVFTADLRDHEVRCELVAKIKAEGFCVELLINNAGFGSLGPFDQLEPSWELDMIEVNCRTPVHLTHLFLDDLLAAKNAAVINVCSTAAFQAMPYMATYGATKSFLLSFTTALAAEFEGRIKFLAQCPGPTRTEFHLVVGLPEKLNFIPSATAHDVVAAAIKRINSDGSSILVNGWINAFLAQLNRVFPRQIAARIVAKILKPVRS